MFLAVPSYMLVISSSTVVMKLEPTRFVSSANFVIAFMQYLGWRSEA